MKGMTSRSLQRLYLAVPLISGERLDPSSDQQHYLLTVLRLKDGDQIKVFNEEDGEYLAKLVVIGRKKTALDILDQQRPAQPSHDLTLAFAPIRRHRMETMIEKATELGVTRLCPVTTAFTQNAQINHHRLSAIATEAAEQSGRLSVPVLEQPQSLHAFCSEQSGKEIIFCDEAKAGEPDHHLLAYLQASDGLLTSIILIGPEGGFSDDERRFLLDQPHVNGVSLGHSILRTDTAAVLAIGLWQAIYEKKNGIQI